jgi:hypothetical protein
MEEVVRDFVLLESFFVIKGISAGLFFELRWFTNCMELLLFICEYDLLNKDGSLRFEFFELIVTLLLIGGRIDLMFVFCCM